MCAPYKASPYKQLGQIINITPIGLDKVWYLNFQGNRSRTFDSN